jgi:transposase-like protein
MVDIIERLVAFRDRGNLSREDRDMLADAANEIQSLRKQFLEGVTTILSQVKENNEIIKDAKARLDRAGL